MQRVNVNVSGEGPHEIIPAVSGKRILLHNFVLSFAHSFDESQPAVAMSGADVLEGYLVFDGEKIFWSRDPADTMRISPDHPFQIRLATGVKCMGFVEYEVGVW